jgi:hypothetical protein
MDTKVLSPLIHVSAQAVLGTVVGAVCNGVFPKSNVHQTKLSKSDLAWSAAEIIAQLSVNGFVTVALLKIQADMKLESEDKTGAFAYMTALQASQPHLMRKIEHVARHVTAYVSETEARLLEMGHSKNAPLSAGAKQKLNERK